MLARLILSVGVFLAGVTTFLSVAPSSLSAFSDSPAQNWVMARSDAAPFYSVVLTSTTSAPNTTVASTPAPVATPTSAPAPTPTPAPKSSTTSGGGSTFLIFIGAFFVMLLIATFLPFIKNRLNR